MASEIAEHDQHASPSRDDPNGNGALAAGDNRGVKRPRTKADMDDDDDSDSKPGRERRKIEIKFIQDKSRRHITFSKRKAGIMKKAYELSVLTGTQVLLLVVSETGLVYTFTTPKLQPLVTKPEGKNLIQACLNAPEPTTSNDDGLNGDNPVESPEDHTQAQQSRVPAPMPGPPQMPYSMTPEQAQAMRYGGYPQMPGGQPGYMPQPGMQHPQHGQ